MCQGFVPSGLHPLPHPSSSLLALQHRAERGRTAPAGHAAGHPADLVRGLSCAVRGSLAACRRRGGERPGEVIKIHPDLGYSRGVRHQGTVYSMA